MEWEPQPKGIINFVSRTAPVAAAALALCSPATARGETSVERTPTPISREMLDANLIPDNAPDISYPQRDGFSGSKKVTPGAIDASGLYANTYTDDDECIQVFSSRPSRKWAACTVVAKDRKGPVQCAFIVRDTLSYKLPYPGQEEAPCYKKLMRTKNKGVDEFQTNTPPPKEGQKIKKFVNGTPVKLVDSPACDYTAYRKYATDHPSFSNMSGAPGGFYYNAHTLKPGEEVKWRWVYDKKAVRVLTDHGWYNIMRQCLPDKLPMATEENTPVKTNATQDGPNPNGDMRARTKKPKRLHQPTLRLVYRIMNLLAQ